VSYAHNDNFDYWQTTEVKTKFKGNSIDVYPYGKCHLYLKKYDELYSWTSVTTTVHNVVVGQMWVDNYGEVEVINHKTKEKAKVKYTQCSWFSNKGRYEVAATLLDAAGKPKGTLKGKWNEYVTGPNGTILWKHDTKKENKYGFSKFTMNLNVITPELKSHLPPYDSRFRSDRAALERGDKKGAAGQKHVLEEKQRAERRTREAKKEEWQTRYFHKVPGREGETYYQLHTDYWAVREERKKKSLEKQSSSNTSTSNLATDVSNISLSGSNTVATQLSDSGSSSTPKGSTSDS